MIEITERERRIRARLMTDFAHYAAKCLKVRAKGGRIVPLKLNSAQKYIHERLEEQLVTTGRVRALILKGRQQGCSTMRYAVEYSGGKRFVRITAAPQGLTEGIQLAMLALAANAAQKPVDNA